MRGLPIWATLIGLEHAGELVLGVASAPGLNARWWAGRGLGAFRDGDPISASAVKELEDAQISFSWDTYERFAADGIGDKMVALAHECWRLRGVGDFWQHVLVADGKMDIAIDPIVNLWDIAALVPIIEETGARWSTVEGRRDVNGGSFVSTNGTLHDAVLAALAGLIWLPLVQPDLKLSGVWDAICSAAGAGISCSRNKPINRAQVATFRHNTIGPTNGSHSIIRQ